MVEKIKFLSENYEIEGLFNKRDKNKGVVITHPHPLYGGDMYNLVVETIVHVYNIKGYSTLKFNFRGLVKTRDNMITAWANRRTFWPPSHFLLIWGWKK